MDFQGRPPLASQAKIVVQNILMGLFNDLGNTMSNIVASQAKILVVKKLTSTLISNSRRPLFSTR